MKNAFLDLIQQADSKIEDKLPATGAKKATPMDTGLKWAPLTILLVADSSGVKTKSSFKQQALRVIVAEAILNVILMPLKNIVNRERPVGNSESFPSGHSATGFLCSQVLYEELKESNAALTYSGYTLSFTTC